MTAGNEIILRIGFPPNPTSTMLRASGLELEVILDMDYFVGSVSASTRSQLKGSVLMLSS